MNARVTILIFLFVYLNASGQSLFNNGATISIKSNTTFSVGENATNNGTIINNGDFLISGAWINNGTYDAGTGKFTLNSPGDQIVNHNAQAFERLIIRGGGNKIFQADIKINEDLDLQNGILVSANGAKLVISENAQITGGSASSYVAGPLYLNLSSNNALYPIGTNTQYLPVTLSNINSSNALLGFEVVAPNPISAFATDEISELSTDYAWQMTVENGLYEGAIITLPVEDQNFIIDMEQAIVVQSLSLDDPYTSLGSSNYAGNSTKGTVTSLENALGTFYSIGYFDGTPKENLDGISVINAITPETQDGKHDFLKIQNIEQYPNNKVNIYNRWGDLVYEISGYNNDDVIFTGISNVKNGVKLDNGTYFYAIEAGGKVKTGFFVIRR